MTLRSFSCAELFTPCYLRGEHVHITSLMISYPFPHPKRCARALITPHFKVEDSESLKSRLSIGKLMETEILLC